MRLGFVLFFVSLFFLSSCSSGSKQISYEREISISPNAININTADEDELEKIPYIGEKIARRIIEHRQDHGRFRKPEHLMQVQGISDGRFRKIRHLIKIE